MLQRCAGAQPGLWGQYGQKVVVADAQVLDLCLSSRTKVRKSVQRSALTATRRALRKIVAADGEVVIAAMIHHLAAKEQKIGLRGAVFLGVIAGVCARLPSGTAILERNKSHFFAFYRELVGSRTLIPSHVGSALNEFFNNFVTATDLREEIVPTLEKALLRAPEVVLDLIPPMILSLPPGLDLAEILAEHLLKPLLSNIKSQSAAVRNGVMSTFVAIIERSREVKHLEKVMDDVLGPLPKLASAEQRSMHAYILGLLPPLSSRVESLCACLCRVIAKEPNEVALIEESSSLVTHFSSSCPSQDTVKSVLEVFTKGLNDKKPNVRKIWALKLGNVLDQIRKLLHSTDLVSESTMSNGEREISTNGSISESAVLPPPLIYQQGDQVRNQNGNIGFKGQEFPRATAVKLVKILIKPLLDIFEDIVQNPLAAAQSGLVVAAYVLISVSISDFVEDQDVRSLIRKAKIQDRAFSDPKSSFLLNHRVYSKLMTQEEISWAIRALAACSTELVKVSRADVREAWAHAFLYFITASEIPYAAHQEAMAALSDVSIRHRDIIPNIIIQALWRWHQQVELMQKDTAALAAKTGTSRLSLVVRSICPTPEQVRSKQVELDVATVQAQLINMLVLCRPEILPQVNWIEICLRLGQDPGTLVQANTHECMHVLQQRLDDREGDKPSAIVELAVYNTAAELAFIAPVAVIPQLIQQIRQSLPADKVSMYGPTDIAIARTPEGTAFVDVLSSKGQIHAVEKNSKDYDTVKWEEEIRNQIAQKKGHEKKLTNEEKSKVNTQIAKEAIIRQEVIKLERLLRKGVGLIRALADGPPVEAGLWLGSSLNALIEVIDAGVGRLIGQAADDAFIACAKFVSSRLGMLRKFIGVATLRALESSTLPVDLQEEPLGDLVTRLLYRLRFASEQRSFDSVSLVYILPFIFAILRQGGVGQSTADEADEQVTLALEFLSYHMETFADSNLPREELLALLIESMQRYSQHYKLIKDCLSDICRAVAVNTTLQEIAVILRGCIVPQASVRTAVLQAARDLDLTDLDFCEELWLENHDDLDENVWLSPPHSQFSHLKYR